MAYLLARLSVEVFLFQIFLSDYKRANMSFNCGIVLVRSFLAMSVLSVCILVCAPTSWQHTGVSAPGNAARALRLSRVFSSQGHASVPSGVLPDGEIEELEASLKDMEARSAVEGEVVVFSPHGRNRQGRRRKTAAAETHARAQDSSISAGTGVPPQAQEAQEDATAGQGGEVIEQRVLCYIVGEFCSYFARNYGSPCRFETAQ